MGKRPTHVKHTPLRTSRSAPDSGPRASYTRLALWVVVVAALVAALAIRVRLASNPAEENGRDTPSHPDPPVSVCPSEVLGLSADLPQTVEALKQEALDTCTRVVDDLPPRPETRAVAALTNMRFGQTTEALQWWEDALRLNSRFSPAHLGLGTIALQRGEYEKAVASLRTALELNPDLAEAYAPLIETLLHQAKVEDALAVAEEYVQRFPEARESHYWLGQTLLEMQRYEDARRSHGQAIQIDPKLIPAYYSLALACTRLGRLDEAAEYRRQFAMLKEGDLELERGRNRQYRDLAAQRDIVAGTHMAAGDVQLRFGDVRKAEAHWLRGAAINPQHTPCREALVVLYQRQGRKESALNVVQQLTAIEPQVAGHWVQAGNLHAQLGQDQMARDAFRRAIQCDADAVEAYLGLVELDLRGGQISPETVSMARKAVDLQPSVRSYLLLGAALQEAGVRARMAADPAA